MSKIVLIGNGFMAGAIAKGLIARGERDIAFVNEAFPDEAKCKAKELNIKFETAKDLPAAQTVVLAFKPQSLRQAAPMYAPYLGKGQTLISILAGVDIATLTAAFGNTVGIVRVMPNLALSVGHGAVAYAPSKTATDTDCKRCEYLFDGVAAVQCVKEDNLSAITALSGSGPAYFYYLAEQMTKTGVALGLDPQISADFAKQTLIGASALWQNDSADAAELRARITSAKGTTDAAIRAMEAADFDKAVAAGMTACAARSDELQKEIAKLF